MCLYPPPSVVRTDQQTGRIEDSLDQGPANTLYRSGTAGQEVDQVMLDHGYVWRRSGKLHQTASWEVNKSQERYMIVLHRAKLQAEHRGGVMLVCAPCSGV